MKKIFLFVLLFLLFSVGTVFSQSGDLGVIASANVFSCKDDVCAVRILMTVRSPFYFSTNYMVEYKLVDVNGIELSTFQTEIFTLQGNETRSIEQVILMDRARLEKVKKVVGVLKYFAPPIRRGYGWQGYGPRYWQGTCPRSF